ncbi:putative transcription factor B3-Domain family [Helianthus debilis subsp. tardiflorus]
MDPSNNSTSFLKLIEDDDPVFLEIPNDFASMMRGEQPPYNESVKIVDGNNIWFVRLKRTGLGPVLGAGFIKVVRDSGITKNDYILFQSFGPSSFFVSVFESCVHENCFISKIKPEDDIIVSSIDYTISLLNILLYLYNGFLILIITTFSGHDSN